MSSQPSSTHELYIHRHVLQAVMHDALAGPGFLNDKQASCQGLLFGGDNMLMKALPVTQKTYRTGDSAIQIPDHATLFGIYIAASSLAVVDQAAVRALAGMLERVTAHAPRCYLLLELGHQGRVDVSLFADAACSQPIPLQLCEDGSGGAADQCGSLYPATVTR